MIPRGASIAPPGRVSGDIATKRPAAIAAPVPVSVPADADARWFAHRLFGRCGADAEWREAARLAKTPA
jgi:hypothetical protein